MYLYLLKNRIQIESNVMKWNESVGYFNDKEEMMNCIFNLITS